MTHLKLKFPNWSTEQLKKEAYRLIEKAADNE